MIDTNQEGGDVFHVFLDDDWDFWLCSKCMKSFEDLRTVGYSEVR